MSRPTGSSDRDIGLIEPTSIDRWPRGISCDGGFRLLGTPLGFGRARRSSLLFLADVESPVPRGKRRILATPFTAAAIGAEERELDALTLWFDRKIRLGRMDIRLVPSGLGPGSAQLEVGFRDRRILLSAGVRLAPPLAAPPAEIPSCDLLLLDAEPAEPRPPSTKRSASRLAEWVRSTPRRGRALAVVCGSHRAAIDATSALSRLDLPLRACRPLFEMLRRLEGVGLAAPRLRRLEQTWPTSGAVLHMASLWPEGGLPMAGSATAAYVGPGRARPDWAAESFRLGEAEDRPGLVSYALGTGATQVALGPRCDDSLAVALTRAGLSVHRVDHPTQMPLPL